MGDFGVGNKRMCSRPQSAFVCISNSEDGDNCLARFAGPIVRVTSKVSSSLGKVMSASGRRKKNSAHIQSGMFGLEPFQVSLSTMWRILFFSIMAIFPHPEYATRLPPWSDAFSYDQFRWLPRCNPGSWATSKVERTFALLAAANILPMCSCLSWATIRMLYVCADITHFVNHDYLFSLLGALTALQCSRSDNVRAIGILLIRAQFAIM